MNKSAANLLHRFDPWIRLMIVFSTVAYLIELSITDANGSSSLSVFRWIHAFVAVCFSVEYVVRWIDDAQDHFGWHYPQSAIGIIDLLAIVPFWLGFIWPTQWLDLLRTLRVFVLLKYFRYSRSLQLTALSFYRSIPALKPLVFSMGIIVVFCSVAIFEIEHAVQPDKFRTLFDAVYFTMVTVATVGYGDLSPVSMLGRFLVMVTFVTGLAVFAGMLGVLGASFFKVIEEEIDPTIDPIAEFRHEREKRLQRRRASGTG